MSIRNRLDEFDKQLKLAGAQLARTGRTQRPMVYLDDPEDGVEELRLPGWVREALPTIEIGRPDRKSETGPEWVARLTREAAGASNARVETTRRALRPAVLPPGRAETQESRSTGFPEAPIAAPASKAHFCAIPDVSRT